MNPENKPTLESAKNLSVETIDDAESQQQSPSRSQNSSIVLDDSDEEYIPTTQPSQATDVKISDLSKKMSVSSPVSITRSECSQENQDTTVDLRQSILPCAKRKVQYCSQSEGEDEVKPVVKKLLKSTSDTDQTNSELQDMFDTQDYMTQSQYIVPESPPPDTESISKYCDLPTQCDSENESFVEGSPERVTKHEPGLVIDSTPEALNKINDSVKLCSTDVSVVDLYNSSVDMGSKSTIDPNSTCDNSKLLESDVVKQTYPVAEGPRASEPIHCESSNHSPEIKPDVKEIPLSPLQVVQSWDSHTGREDKPCEVSSVGSDENIDSSWVSKKLKNDPIDLPCKTLDVQSLECNKLFDKQSEGLDLKGPISIDIRVDRSETSGLEGLQNGGTDLKNQMQSTPQDCFPSHVAIEITTPDLCNGNGTESLLSKNETVIEYRGFFEFSFKATLHPITKEVIQKEVVDGGSITELMTRKGRDRSSSCITSDKSTPPTGSVCSDTLDLPFALPSRLTMASLTSSSSGSSYASGMSRKGNFSALYRSIKDKPLSMSSSVLSDSLPWVNEYKFQSAFNNELHKAISELSKESHSSDAISSNSDSGKKKTPSVTKMTRGLRSSSKQTPCSPVHENGSRDIKKRSEPSNTEDLEECQTATPQKRTRMYGSTPQSKAKDMETPAKATDENRVFAKWVDKHYYSGRLVSQEGTRCKIEFDDGNTKTLPKHLVIPFTILKPGQLVFAKTDDDETCEAAKIVKCTDVANQKYQVELDDSNTLMNVSCTQLYLTEDMAKILIEDSSVVVNQTPVKGLAEVNIDNIVVGKRSRVPSAKSQLSCVSFRSTPVTPAEPVASTSSLRKISKQSKKPPEIFDSDSESDYQKLSDGQRSLEWTPGLDIDLLVAPDEAESVISKSKKAVPQDYSEMMGPIPKDNNLFADYCFLLAYTKPSYRAKICSSTEEAESCEEKQYEDYEASHPFKEDYLRKQLVAGGGIIYDTFEDVPKSRYGSCILVTNRPSCCAKFLLCLASGIDIILHCQIAQICTQGNKQVFKDVIRNKIYHSGWSLEEHKLIYTPSASCIKKIFKDLKFLLFTSSPDEEANRLFYKFWKTILSKTGAASVTENLPDLNYIDIVVTDNSFPKQLEENIQQFGAHGPTIVSTTWVLQSLLHGQKRKFDALEMYSHLYEDYSY